MQRLIQRLKVQDNTWLGAHRCMSVYKSPRNSAFVTIATWNITKNNFVSRKFVTTTNILHSSFSAVRFVFHFCLQSCSRLISYSVYPILRLSLQWTAAWLPVLYHVVTSVLEETALSIHRWTCAITQKASSKAQSFLKKHWNYLKEMFDAMFLKCTCVQAYAQRSPYCIAQWHEVMTVVSAHKEWVVLEK
jgi:hypothetical protein